MKTPIRLLSLSLGDNCYLPFRTLFQKFDIAPFWKDIRKEDCILFCGGTDVSSSFYGEKRGNFTGAPNTERDEYERGIYQAALRSRTPMIGICRGSQFLTVMNGGKLVQHCTGHALQDTHTMYTYDGRKMQVTSTHHQMMIPKGNFELLGWAAGLSDKYLNGDNDDQGGFYKDREPEIVWYPDTCCLCIQGHPEYMTSQDEFWQYSGNLVKEFIFGE